MNDLHFLVEPLERRIFTCPNQQCGFNVIETHYLYAKFDLGCPRCGKHKVSEFTHKGKVYSA